MRNGMVSALAMYAHLLRQPQVYKMVSLQYNTLVFQGGSFLGRIILRAEH